MSNFKGWTAEAVYDVKHRAPAKQAKQKTETANKITANVIRAINSQPGCVAYRINNVGIWDEAKQIHRRANTEKGLPDIWACLRGRFATIEVKAGRDKMSLDQLHRKSEIERAGGLYCIAYSTDGFLDWFTKTLMEL